jgi:hypothetical protein
MVVDVLILMDNHIVHARQIIVVDDVSFDIIHIIMSIYTIVHTIMVKNKLTFSSMNKRHYFILTFNKIKDFILSNMYTFIIYILMMNENFEKCKSSNSKRNHFERLA